MSFDLQSTTAQKRIGLGTVAGLTTGSNRVIDGGSFIDGVLQDYCMCHHFLSRLNTEFKKTIIMVTHDPRAAEKAKVHRYLDKGELA